MAMASEVVKKNLEACVLNPPPLFESPLWSSIPISIRALNSNLTVLHRASSARRALSQRPPPKSSQASTPCNHRALAASCSSPSPVSPRVFRIPLLQSSNANSPLGTATLPHRRVFPPAVLAVVRHSPFFLCLSSPCLQPSSIVIHSHLCLCSSCVSTVSAVLHLSTLCFAVSLRKSDPIFVVHFAPRAWFFEHACPLLIHGLF